MFFKKKRKINEVERKERSDKKAQVAPTVDAKLKKEIERFAFILDQPVKFVGEVICDEAIRVRDVVELIAPYFQRGVLRFENSLYYGSEENESLRDVPFSNVTDRISIRFEKHDYANIQTLANLLDVSPSRTVAILLDSGLRHPRVIETVVMKYNHRGLIRDDAIQTEFKRLMKFVNKRNPYETNAFNKRFLEIIIGISTEAKRATKRAVKMTEKMVDRETYKWSFGDDK